MAGTGRKGEAQERATGLHSGGLGRRRNIRHPVGQASWRNRRYDDKHCQYWVGEEGADVVIDYKKQDFEDILHDYDVVLNSQDGKTLNWKRCASGG